MTARWRPRLALVFCALVVSTTCACFGSDPKPVRLTVLASSELVDLQPLLGELRRDTGVELAMDFHGTVRTSQELSSGRYRHDLAWLSSDRYLRLARKQSRTAAEPPMRTPIMLSPVVIGLKPAAAKRLRALVGHADLSWADIADGAAQGLIRFGMTDPRTSNSGLAALVGVATAAADTGGALRVKDITCDRLRGFFSGHKLTAETSGSLIDKFVAAQDRADALINYESVLLSLNTGKRLREPLEIVYPRDGLVVSEYPVLLLDPAQRAAYDKVVTWLKRESTQKKIMETTLRRPLEPKVPRDPRLSAPLGNALYFPDEQGVLDALVRNYDDPGRRALDQVLFVLDFSRSMKGARISALQSAFAGLGGADDSSTGKFLRFHRGEEVTIIRFGGRVLAEQRFTVGKDGSMNKLHDFVAGDGFDDSTAIWSALAHAYDRSERLLAADSRRRVSIVLMTDGRNNAGISADEFLRRSRPVGAHVHAIQFGEADPVELSRVARATGGRMVNGNSTANLLEAFKEIRGCR